MQEPLQIAFHNMDHSDMIEELVRDRVARLEKFTDSIISCRIIVRAPHKQKTGSTLGISIDLGMPGRDLHVNREGRVHETRADAHRVIREAFDIAERQVEEYDRISRREVKRHDNLPTYGRVVRIFPEQDYGFIETADGVDLYFHRTIVENDAFDQLTIGSEVLYQRASEEGPAGPQASMIKQVHAGQRIR
ncbi:MAG TPA: HPF/RaiA family ribosome-associated protein [Geminicoccaceae bacterium]|nr:HPF/RaiA family ribosome-associated protein [Geminicoccaceae bacterium]